MIMSMKAVSVVLKVFNHNLKKNSQEGVVQTYRKIEKKKDLQPYLHLDSLIHNLLHLLYHFSCTLTHFLNNLKISCKHSDNSP